MNGYPRFRWIDASNNETSQPRAVAPRHAISAEQLLAARGITDPAAVSEFLSPNLSLSVPPSQMQGMTQAAEIICGFVSRNQKIVIFGDYDADGISAAAILSKTLTLAGGEVSVFLPDRATEGYGFTPAALARCMETHSCAKLLITVDCGISQTEATDIAHAAGITVVITDHHEQTRAPSPNAAAIIFPRAAGNPPTIRDLCGAGVAFKLAHQILKVAAENTEGGFLRRITTAEAREFLRSILPLAALGTVADIVPLTDENRIIVANGLRELNKPRSGGNLGLDAMKTIAKLRGGINSEDIAFAFAPRINASGRIADPTVSLRLLLTEDRAEALALARILEDNNTERRESEAQAFAAANTSIDAPQHSIVAFEETMRPGVAGLVASRLSEKYNLPSISLCLPQNDDASENLRGSARCPDIEGLNLSELLGECAHLLINYGGHRAAAGLTVAQKNLAPFRAAFDAACARALAGKNTRPKLAIDAWLAPATISHELKYMTQRLEPFGANNRAPCFAISGAVLKAPPRKFGKTCVNWELKFEDIPCPAVLYRRDTFPFKPGDALDIAFAISENQFDRLILEIKDARASAAL